MNADLLVVGAGVAGLTAARLAAEAGLRVILLEARQRAGGRIHTIRDPHRGAPIELGAEFVHGLPAEIWMPCRQTGISMIESEGGEWLSVNGRMRPAHRFDAMTDHVLRQMEQHEPDRSFEEFLQTATCTEEEKQWATEYLEGFNAAHKERIGVHGLIQTEKALEEVQGDRIFRMEGGYQRLVKVLLERLPPEVSIQFGVPVESVTWKRRSVEIATPRLIVRATGAILTLPLGVWKRPGALRFEPEIPEKRSAAERLEMGSVLRVSLVFRERFWASGVAAAKGRELNSLTFLYSHDRSFPTWWTPYPSHAPVLVGWASAKRAERLVGLTEAEIVHEALAALARLTGEPESRLNELLESTHMHDWQADPFSGGAYSYVPAGAMDAPQVFAAPIADTLFFAGEATNTEGHEGTVHGAIATGMRAAREAIRAK